MADVIADPIPDPPRVITLAVSHDQSFCGDSPPHNYTAHFEQQKYTKQQQCDVRISENKVITVSIQQ